MGAKISPLHVHNSLILKSTFNKLSLKPKACETSDILHFILGDRSYPGPKDQTPNVHFLYMHTWQRGFGFFGPMTKVSSRVSFYCYIIRSAVSLKNWVHSNVCNIELVTASLKDFKIPYFLK